MESRLSGESYIKTFPNTAVLVKPSATPARPMKQRPDFELGVTPLPQEYYKTSIASSVPHSRDLSGLQFLKLGTLTQALTVHSSNESSAEKSIVRDANHHIYRHVDQLGNPVEVHSVVKPLTVMTLWPNW